MATGTQGGRGAALGRAAEAMLRALGGVEVKLLLPMAASDATARQLGLAGIEMQAVAFAPVVVRAQEDEFELLFAASSLAGLAGDAATVLASAGGVLWGDKLLRVKHVSAEYFAGAAYLYRVTAAE